MGTHASATSSDAADRGFAVPGVATASWLPVARARTVRTGRVLGVDASGMPRLALWRDAHGQLVATVARCPHLGADLADGRVANGALVCPFHRWAFGRDGACVHAPGWETVPQRRATALDVEERWGLVWVPNGRDAVTLPESPPGKWRTVLPPPQTIRAHPHLVIANGLDAAHFDAVHGLQRMADPVVTVSPPHVTLEMRGRGRSRRLRALAGGDVHARFTAHGGHLASLHVFAPIPLWALFSASPDTGGGTRTQTVLLLPRGPLSMVRAALVLYSLLHDDARILNGLCFRRAFTEADAPLAAFAAVVDGLPRALV